MVRRYRLQRYRPVLTTQQICSAFNRDPTRNPVTGRKIKIGSKTHRNLQALCVGVEYQQELRLPDEVLEYPLYDDVVNYIMEFIDFDSCEQLTQGTRTCKNKRDFGWGRNTIYCYDYCDERIAQWYPDANNSMELFQYDFKTMQKSFIRNKLKMFGIHIPQKASLEEHRRVALQLVRDLKADYDAQMEQHNNQDNRRQRSP